MKNINRILLLVLLVAFCCHFSFAQQAANGINQLGQELITALQTNSVDNYLKVHLNPADLEEFNKKTAKLSKKTRQDRNDAEQLLEGMEESSRSNFEEVIQKGITEQINWKEVTFTGVDNTTKMQKEGDLYIIHNPVVRFAYKDEERKLRVNKIVRLKRGWVVVDNVMLE
jgi:uncharacterized protein YxeA